LTGILLIALILAITSIFVILVMIWLSFEQNKLIENKFEEVNEKI